MTLAESMFRDLPINHVTCDMPGWMTKRDCNHTIRELKCGQCGETLAAVVLKVYHNADMVWPFKVVCEGAGNHRLVARNCNEDANLVCHGRAVDTEDAKKFLERYANDDQR